MLRYYQVCAALTKAKSHSDKVYIFDAEHEKRRKEQLKKLFERTPEQVDEEQTLLAELRKIEQRKKERDRKTQDLQKLITAADHQADPRKSERKSSKKSSSSSRNRPNKTDTSHVSATKKFTLYIVHSFIKCSCNFLKFYRQWNQLELSSLISKIVVLLFVLRESNYQVVLVKKR